MRERPILFSGPMVRALLEGRKSQTRRAQKPQPARGPTIDGDTIWRGGPATCPYGAPGDRLWVRETFGVRDDGRKVYYAATPELGAANLERWRSPLYMPRWASRITLELSSVRVERLQDISEADARAEGVEHVPFSTIGAESGFKGPDGLLHTTAVQAYDSLWDSLNAERAPWASNPFVWVLSFRRVYGLSSEGLRP